MTGLDWARHALGLCTPTDCDTHQRVLRASHQSEYLPVGQPAAPSHGTAEQMARILEPQGIVGSGDQADAGHAPWAAAVLPTTTARLRIRKLRGLPDDGRPTKAWSWRIADPNGRVLANKTAYTHGEALAVGCAYLEEMPR